MASKPPVISRLLTRNKLSEVFKNHELIKAFENLFLDVTQTIPDAISNSTADADTLIASQAFQPRVPTMPPSDKADLEKVLAMEAFLPRVQVPQSSKEDVEKMLSIGAFFQRVPPTPIRDDAEASRVLASQIFGG